MSTLKTWWDFNAKYPLVEEWCMYKELLPLLSQPKTKLINSFHFVSKEPTPLKIDTHEEQPTPFSICLAFRFNSPLYTLNRLINATFWDLCELWCWLVVPRERDKVKFYSWTLADLWSCVSWHAIIVIKKLHLFWSTTSPTIFTITRYLKLHNAIYSLLRYILLFITNFGKSCLEIVEQKWFYLIKYYILCRNYNTK